MNNNWLWIIIFIIVFALMVCEQIWWRNKIKYTREYVLPIILNFHLENVPITPRFWGAITFNKKRITMCVKYGYSIEKLAFVLLHEYAHVLTTSVGHTDEFWANFQKLLNVARTKHIFIDYYFNKHKYCTL